MVCMWVWVVAVTVMVVMVESGVGDILHMSACV